MHHNHSITGNTQNFMIPANSLNSLSHTKFRSTITKIPKKHSLIKSSTIPFAVSVYMGNDVEERQPNVMERCSECKSYINPYVEIIPPGLQWKCNICYKINRAQFPFEGHAVKMHKSTPIFNAEINQSINSNYSDKCLNEIESDLIVQNEDIKRTPLTLFLIEVTSHSLKNRILHAILEIINQMEFKDRNIIFLFYAEKTYLLANDGSFSIIDPKTPPFVYAEEVIFRDTSKINFQPYISFFEKQIKNNFNNLSGALKVSRRILEQGGGSILSFISCINNGNYSNDFYAMLGLEYTHFHISVSHFIFAHSNVDLKELSILSRMTGGMLFYYPNFNGLEMYFNSKLMDDLSFYFSMKIGYGGVSKVRASKGVRIINYYGAFDIRKTHLLSMPNVHPAHCITFECEIDEILTSTICFQVAILRTENRKKKVRIFNFCIPVDPLNSFYAYLDINAILQFMCIKSIYNIQKGHSLEKISDCFEQKIINISKKYKELNGQEKGLLLPPSLTSLPLLTLCLSKNIPFRPSSYTPPDYRAYYSYLFITGIPKLIDVMIYPWLLPLHSLYNISEGKISIKDIYLNRTNLSLDYLELDGFYLLYTGVNIFFFIGCECVSGVPSLLIDDDLLTGKFVLDIKENLFSEMVFFIINYLRKDIFLSPNYVLIKDGETGENVYRDVFFSYFFEDRGHNLGSIEDYLNKLKSLISK